MQFLANLEGSLRTPPMRFFASPRVRGRGKREARDLGSDEAITFDMRLLCGPIFNRDIENKIAQTRDAKVRLEN